MQSKSSLGSNVLNRSPWLVRARSKPLLDKQFPFNRQNEAEAYLKSLAVQGVKAKLAQLETSFQLRVRRKGVKVQFITFDTKEEAEQARLKIESDLSVSIIRYYSKATQVSLRDIMVRYRDEVVPAHNRAIVTCLFYSPEMKKLSRRSGGRWLVQQGNLVFAPWRPIREHVAEISAMSLRFEPGHFR